MSLSPSWPRVVLPIALLYACRMLGLFLLIPVFTLFAHQLTQATPTLIGIALGAYGLSQALTQIPFGVLSDYIGRKPVIQIGLVLLLLGSLFGAYTTHIYGMIFARAIQGVGAIGSVLLALLSDLTPVEHRAKSMAVIGVTIGLSFSIAMILGPLLANHSGLDLIFYFTAFLAFLGIFITQYAIPTPPKAPTPEAFRLRLLCETFQEPVLLRLNMGILIQHALLTATFYVLPLQLHAFIQTGLLTNTWHFYLPLILLSFIVMAPVIAIAEKKKIIQKVLGYAIVTMGVTEACLIYFHENWVLFSAMAGMYFLAFNLAEAFLPSQISKQAPAAHKGAAMGIYSTCQFLGIFVGGAAAGVIYQHYGMPGVFSFNTLLAGIWWLLFQTGTKYNNSSLS